MKNEMMIFKNEEMDLKVRTIQNKDGSIGINTEDAAIGFGFTQNKKGKVYVRWETINNYINELGFSQQVGKDDFIPESLFYMLGMKASNNIARKFQMWIATEVLPNIRKHGAYIGDGEIDEEYINNKVRFSEKRTINTFANSNVDDVKQLVKEFKDYAIDLDTKTRIVRCNSSIKGLQRLHDTIAKESTLNIAECYKILQYMDEIKK